MSDEDIEKLADKVYRLMLAEVRLGQSRGESPPPRGDARGAGLRSGTRRSFVA